MRLIARSLRIGSRIDSNSIPRPVILDSLGPMIIQSWDDSMNISSPAPKDEASDAEKDKSSIDTNATPVFTAVGHLLIEPCAEPTGSGCLSGCAGGV
jgi:hypothetical protein